MTQNTLTAERFRAIVDAYGASPLRWPEGERLAAQAFAAGNAVLVQPWLDDARETDGFLDQLNFAHLGVANDHLPSADIVAFPKAVSGHPAGPRRHVLSPTVLMAGLGLAACIAGAALGVNLSLTGLSDVRAQTVLEQAQIVDAGTDE